MKKYVLIIIAFFVLATTSFAQQNNWNNWTWLIGEWKGEGSGQPGQGDGAFSFAFDLDKNIIVRKNHTEFPATANNPALVHDDLMIVYLDFTGNPSKAIYFDNEGHTINYTVSYADNTITFLSEKIPNIPIFRLTYILLDNDAVNIKFEMSFDGENFMTHIEGKSKKVK
jgi:hypothetical protein